MNQDVHVYAKSRFTTADVTDATVPSQAGQANAEATLTELRQQIGGSSMELVRAQQQLQALSRQYSAAAYQLHNTGAHPCAAYGKLDPLSGHIWSRLIPSQHQNAYGICIMSGVVTTHANKCAQQHSGT